jgi:hypothetical protein
MGRIPTVGVGAALLAAVLLVSLAGGVGARPPAAHSGNVLAIDQSSYTTEQSNFTVSLEVANSTGIDFVYFTFCQLSSPLCYLPVSMLPHGGNWFVGTTKPMTQYNGMTVGVRAGYNITIEYSDNVNVTEPSVPNPFGNLSIAQSVTGEYMFQMTVMNQLYELSGAVTDHATGLGIGGATVSISPGNDSPVTTSASGQYAFPSLANGTYTVSVSASGYPETTATVPISGGNVVKDLSLSNATTSSNGGGSTPPHAAASWFAGTNGLALVGGVVAVLIALSLFVLVRARRKAGPATPRSAGNSGDAGSPTGPKPE